MSERGKQRRMIRRQEVDAAHEQTTARRAFQAWRDGKYPIAETWVTSMNEKNMDDWYWPIFLAGWIAAVVRQP